MRNACASRRLHLFIVPYRGERVWWAVLTLTLLLHQRGRGTSSWNKRTELLRNAAFARLVENAVAPYLPSAQRRGAGGAPLAQRLR